MALTTHRLKTGHGTRTEWGEGRGTRDGKMGERGSCQAQNGSEWRIANGFWSAMSWWRNKTIHATNFSPLHTYMHAHRMDFNLQ
jgi:hypothetical protein